MESGCFLVIGIHIILRLSKEVVLNRREEMGQA